MNTRNIVAILIVLIILLTAIGIFLGINLYSKNETTEELKEVFALTLDDMYCDLKDGKGIVKLNVTIETHSKETLDNLEKKIYLIRNNINEIVRNKTQEELKGKDGQVNLQKEIKDNLVQVFEDDRIANVYFNQFVIQ
ncbi:MAG: flagellar basal body-associated FliL family protein [Tissierellia bacterium]|nr:flagellar basal body-associated FliL family protein [Tissierellia bacterium]